MIRPTLNEKLQELRKTHLVPIEQSARRMFASEDGKRVLNALERVFGDDSIPKDNTGRVDPNAVLINVGSMQVINYLRHLAEEKTEGQGT